MEGPLSKWTNVVKGWQYRWFVLDEISGLLSYFTASLFSLRVTLRPLDGPSLLFAVVPVEFCCPVIPVVFGGNPPQVGIAEGNSL